MGVWFEFGDTEVGEGWERIWHMDGRMDISVASVYEVRASVSLSETLIGKGLQNGGSR
jgi:hypothetical protein